MKIKLFHDECGRQVLVQQILESEGHCPWDGRAFNRDYTALLVEALEQAESAGGVLGNALEKLASIETGLRIVRPSVLGETDAQLTRINRGRDPQP